MSDNKPKNDLTDKELEKAAGGASHEKPRSKSDEKLNEKELSAAAGGALGTGAKRSHEAAEESRLRDANLKDVSGAGPYVKDVRNQTNRPPEERKES